MVLIAPGALVAAPARVAAPFGLDSVLAWRPGDRWASGVRWSVDPCGPALGRGGPECLPDDEDPIGLPKELENAPGIGEATPFAVYGTYSCLVGGYNLSEAQGFADRHLFAGEVMRVEQALWTGDLGNIPNFSGANGYTAPVALAAQTDPVEALALLEEDFVERNGFQPTIHMSRATATRLAKYLEKRGGRLYSRALDTPVVASAAYPDTEMVASPPLFGYRGEVLSNSTRAGDLLDRGSNTLYAIAEREYLVGFDPCDLVKVTYTIGTP